MNRKYASMIIVLFLMAAVSVVLLQCGGGDRKLGAVFSDTEVTKLKAILDNPDDFNGKKVVLKGSISGQCPSGCHFYYKEGPHKVTVWPQGFDLPKLQAGAGVTAYVQVTAGKESTVFTIVGMKLAKG